VLEPEDTDDNILRSMRFACWITKATDTRSEYVIFIAFPQQQWLRERASMLRYSTLPVLFYIAEPLAVERTTSLLRSVRRRRPFRSAQSRSVVRLKDCVAAIRMNGHPWRIPHSNSCSHSFSSRVSSSIRAVLCASICNMRAPRC
jgi:hypothetical protein